MIRFPSVKSVVKEVLKAEDRLTDEVGIYFVTSPKISSLHQDFFNDPSPTDCISFPIDHTEDSIEGFHVLGDVFICPKTAIDWALDHKTDPYYEATLYLVHALLHLLGYQDIKEKDRKKMREAESKHMENLVNKKLLLKGH